MLGRAASHRNQAKSNLEPDAALRFSTSNQVVQLIGSQSEGWGGGVRKIHWGGVL